MHRVYQIVLVVLVSANATGCSALQVEFGDGEEQIRLHRNKASVREYMDRTAPVGSRWVGHQDTQQLVGELNRYDAWIEK